MVLSYLAEIGKGLLIGLSSTAVGYIKNLPEHEDFDYKKAMPTIIIGGLAGIVAIISNIPLDNATTLVASFGAVTIVNQLWSGFLKWKANRKPF